jgi:glutamate racemase
MVVVACNTASAAAIADLREAFPIPFVGMVPGVKPGANLSRSKRVVILATSGTMDGDLYTRVVDEFGRGTLIRHLHNDSLADVVERGRAGTDLARAEIRAALDPEVQAGADTVVLGCTHFHFLASAIHAEYPNLALIDTSEAVARRAVQVLAERDELAPPGEPGALDIIVSGDRARFDEVAETLGVVPVATEAS